MKKIMVVFGTRPDAIKMCPLVRELQGRERLETVVCVSGQHREMLDSVLEAFSLVPDYDLSVMRPGQTLFDLTERVMEGVRELLQREKPDLLLVHGDTTTALGAALAGFYMKIPVGHVEAGLRTYNTDSPYPEEFNRRAISIISSYDFAPTKSARLALIGEHKTPNNVFVTGNTVLDTLRETIRADFTCPELEWAKGSRLILMTTHRRESIGEPMRNIFRAVKRTIAMEDNIKVIYPVHLNPEIVAIAREVFEGEDRVLLTEPLSFTALHNILERCVFVMTDSGGIQEEATALGKLTLVLRRESERTEELFSGNVRLVGTGENDVYKGMSLALASASLRANAEGSEHRITGGASKMIADIICGL